MIFYPKSYFKNILEIDMNFIEKNNIKANSIGHRQHHDRHR